MVKISTVLKYIRSSFFVCASCPFRINVKKEHEYVNFHRFSKVFRFAPNQLSLIVFEALN